MSILKLSGVRVVSLTRLDSLTRSHSSAVTMNRARSPKYTDSTRNASRSTETLPSGSPAVKSSTSLPWLLSLMAGCSASTVVYRPKSEHLIRSALLPAPKKSLTKEHSVTLCGPIRKMWTHGRSRLEVQDGSSAKRCLQRYAARTGMYSLQRLLTFVSPVQPREQPTTHRSRPPARQ